MSLKWGAKSVTRSAERQYGFPLMTFLYRLATNQVRH